MKNKILVLSLMSLLLTSTLTSASYNFDYEKPSLDGFSYSIFNIVRTNIVSIDMIKMLYGLLTTARFYENQLYVCEAELEIANRRSCGGGSSSSPSPIQEVVEEEQEWSFPYDINDDGIGDLQDFSLFKECKNDHYGEQGDFICDLNNDGIVDIQDISLI